MQNGQNCWDFIKPLGFSQAFQAFLGVYQTAGIFSDDMSLKGAIIRSMRSLMEIWDASLLYLLPYISVPQYTSCHTLASGEEDIKVRV